MESTAAFYQLQFHRHPEAIYYLHQRGLRDAGLIEELGIGYAPGGNLRRHLATQGYPLDRLLETGLINPQGRNTFCRRVIFPCRQHGHIVNLYGRSIGAAFPHRLLPRSKGGLFAWESVRRFRTVILVEGLFDLAVLWPAGFRNTTCGLGAHLTPWQFQQLTDLPDRSFYIVFDQDENRAGQQASRQLSQGGRTATARREALRSALVVAEISFALVLLTGAGLMLKSFLRILAVDPGFRSENVLTTTVNLPDSVYRTSAQMKDFTIAL
jgi:DNA primase